MFFHRGLQDLGWQAKKVLSNLAHQHDRPFHKTRDLAQKASVFNHFKAIGEGLVLGVFPDRIGALTCIQHNKRAFKLRFVVLKTVHSDLLRVHETMAVRGLARDNPVHIKRHNFATRLITQEAND